MVQELIICTVVTGWILIPQMFGENPSEIPVQVNLDMTDSMVRHIQSPSYTYDEDLICMRLGPSILSVICNNPSYSGPSYPSSPVISILFYNVIQEVEQ